MCFSTTPITWHCWRSLPAFGLLLVSLLLTTTAQAENGDYGPNENIYWGKSGFASNGYPENQDGNAAYYLERCEIASTTEGKKYAYCYKDVYQANPGSPSPYWHVNIIGVKAQENCGTGVVPGGAIVQGDFESNGAGIYAIGGCEYSCGINFTLLDGQTSAYDATQCKGQGAPATAPDGFVRPNDGSECTVFDNLDRCLDMDQQEGGACPTGTTYGQVNGEDVCVPSGESTDGLDEGSEGPEGEGGDSPADGSDGGDNGDGGDNPDGGDDGSDGGQTCVPSETEDCEDQGDGSDGECVPTEEEPCDDEGDGSYSSNGCESPPECEGDAIQCGIVQETWEDRCLIHEASEQADGFFSQQTNGIGNLNDEGLELVDSMDMDLSEEMTDFTAVSDPAPASCPEPVQLNLSLGAYEVEFTAFCDLAEQVRPLTLFIFSFLGALSIARAVMGVI